MTDLNNNENLSLSPPGGIKHAITLEDMKKNKGRFAWEIYKPSKPADPVAAPTQAPTEAPSSNDPASRAISPAPKSDMKPAFSLADFKKHKGLFAWEITERSKPADAITAPTQVPPKTPTTETSVAGPKSGAPKSETKSASTLKPSKPADATITPIQAPTQIPVTKASASSGADKPAPKSVMKPAFSLVDFKKHKGLYAWDLSSAYASEPTVSVSTTQLEPFDATAAPEEPGAKSDEAVPPVVHPETQANVMKNTDQWPEAALAPVESPFRPTTPELIMPNPAPLSSAPGPVTSGQTRTNLYAEAALFTPAQSGAPTPQINGTTTHGSPSSASATPSHWRKAYTLQDLKKMRCFAFEAEEGEPKEKSKDDKTKRESNANINQGHDGANSSKNTSVHNVSSSNSRSNTAASSPPSTRHHSPSPDKPVSPDAAEPPPNSIGDACIDEYTKGADDHEDYGKYTLQGEPFIADGPLQSVGEYYPMEDRPHVIGIDVPGLEAHRLSERKKIYSRVVALGRRPMKFASKQNKIEEDMHHKGFHKPTVRLPQCLDRLSRAFDYSSVIETC